MPLDVCVSDKKESKPVTLDEKVQQETLKIDNLKIKTQHSSALSIVTKAESDMDTCSASDKSETHFNQEECKSPVQETVNQFE